MQKKTLCVIAATILFPILEKAGVVYDQHGFDAAAGWFALATVIVKLALFALLVSLLIGVSRPTIRRRAICTLIVALLFPILQKTGIECSQHGWALAGSWLVSVANILKPVFVIVLAALLIDLRHLPQSRVLLVLVHVMCVPVLLAASLATLLSGSIILDESRPTRPGILLRNRAVIGELTDLANEMIQARRVTWVGNGRYRFVFAIRYGSVDYQFASTYIPKNHDFQNPVEAEDLSKVQHIGLPFLGNALEPTDRVLLDPNDYAFCERASKTIRRIGFDNVCLYPEHDVVQFQICDFIGWDDGTRYIYYFCPTGTLPRDFTCTQQLNADWYFARRPRFLD